MVEKGKVFNNSVRIRAQVIIAYTCITHTFSAKDAMTVHQQTLNHSVNVLPVMLMFIEKD